MTLEKGDDGLGIIVAGYVSPDSTNNGKIPFLLMNRKEISKLKRIDLRDC